MNAKQDEWLKNRQWWSDISAMRGDSPFWWHGRTIQEMRSMSRKSNAERQARLDGEIRKHESLIAETKRLTQMRFGKPGADKPRLAAYRARAKAVFGKSLTPEKPRLAVVKSATPRLDAARAAFDKMENGLIRDGFLERIAEYDHHGKLIGHRIKRSGDVASYGRFVPTAQHDRRMKMRLLESQIAQREERERGGKIGVHVLVSPHAP